MQPISGNISYKSTPAEAPAQTTITLEDLKQWSSLHSSDAISGRDYLLIRSQSGHSDYIPRSFKIDCLSVFFCVSGHGSFNVDFQPVEFAPGSLIFFNPTNLISNPVDTSATAPEFYSMFFSRDFVNLMSFDNNVLNFRGKEIDRPGVISLSPQQAEIVSRYFNLIYDSSKLNDEDNISSINIMRSLLVTLIYQIIHFTSTSTSPHTEQADAGHPGARLSRKNYYVRDFMQLVSANFRTQRSVNFYASQLYISPKYLSLIIKEATGYTATEWIDRYVTLEAKNLLRYSGRNVQQIAYDLNFHNQSAFGKYFKHQTGLSPSQFRKS